MTDRDNDSWVNDLRKPGLQREEALRDMRSQLERVLPRGISRWLSPNNAEFDDLVEDVTQETLLRVLSQLDSFEGKGKFANWVYKIAVRLALNELRRRKWRNVSLDFLQQEADDGGVPFQFPSADPSPESMAERREIMHLVQHAINEELTAKQRAVMQAVVIYGVPMEEVARRIGRDRNAVYKLLHDARKRLKSHLKKSGFPPEELLAVFDK
ncbi:MAG: sigma-70 family RNA polymerase sigma factor [Anaerolineales bacterium]